MVGGEHSGRDSESPSPPPKSVPAGGLSNSRMVLVVKKDFSSRESSPEPQISITTNVPEQRKSSTLKNSLHLRLGLPVGEVTTGRGRKSPRSPRVAAVPEITDDDIMEEIIRQKKKKLKKIKKKEKKSSKKRIVVKELRSSEELSEEEEFEEPPVAKRTTSQADDSDEELYKFFEDNVSPEVEKKPRLTRGRTVEDKSDKSSEKKIKRDDKRKRSSSGR